MLQLQCGYKVHGMKFNFKIQQYQTEAVNAVVKVFAGQGFHEGIQYIRDLGLRGKTAEPFFTHSTQMSFIPEDEQLSIEDIEGDDAGFKNEEIYLSDNQLLQNIHKQQKVYCFVCAYVDIHLHCAVQFIIKDGLISIKTESRIYTKIRHKVWTTA